MAASLACVAVMVVLLVSRAPAPASESRRLASGLRAGAAAVAIDVPPGTPLAGYGALARRPVIPDLLGRHPHAFWFRPHAGVRDRPAARALVLEGATARVVWISADLIAVDRELTAEVARRLGLGPATRSTLILSASHTHSGPGAFLDSALMGFLAVDRGDADVRTAVVQALVEAARRADRAKVPARIGTTGVEGPPVTAPRLGEPLDRELVVVKVAAAGGRPIALVWNFAIHGTMLGPRNLQLSGDVMGMASRDLEKALGVPALFVNGAGGDVSPRGHGPEAARATGAELAAAVGAAWRRLDARDATPPSFRTTTLVLGSPTMSLRNCLGGWLPHALSVPLGSVFPGDATLVAVAAGDTAWVTMPGELQSRLGARLKQAARARFKHPFVAGWSNDYLGYFVAAPTWDRTTYVTCGSVYGREAGERLVEAASRLLRGLGDQR